MKFRARLIEGKVAVTGAVSTVQNCFRTFASAVRGFSGFVSCGGSVADLHSIIA